MKKKIAALIFALLLAIQSFGCLYSFAETETIPDDVPTIEFDTEYWVEAGNTPWYKFEAPSRQCYFTDFVLQHLDDSGALFGSDVAHTYFDADGNQLGMISSSNDPEIGDWTTFEPGATYYIRINAQHDGQFFTLSPLKEAEFSTKPEKQADGTDITLTLTEKNVKRFIPGETETDVWDIYTVTEKVILNKENAVYSSNFFVLPYRVYFDNAKLITDSAKVTYSGVERRYADNWDLLESYVKKPYSGDENMAEDAFVFSANHYSYVIDHKGEDIPAVRQYDVYVPAEKRLVMGDDKCIYSAEIDDIYTDVKTGKWYSDSILWCTENAYMSGTGESTFSQDTLLTRAQLVLILAKIDGADLSQYVELQSFTDVAKGKWYSEAVEWAKESGVTAGMGDGIFAPGMEVSRQQLAVFLFAYGLARGTEFPEGADMNKYEDSSDISAWAYDAMSRAVAAELITGTSETTVSPKANATRAQISLMIKKFCENLLPDKDIGSYFLLGGNCGYAVYDEIISLTGKENPHVLHIGMAGTVPEDGFSETEWEFVRNRGCTAETLTLEDLETDAAAKKIAAADIIHVGGGSSRMLLARLKKYGTDQYIRDAALNGTVMCGSSAGAICFGAYGSSSIGYNRFDNLKSTGCVTDVIVCPHGFETLRVEEMKSYLLKNPALVGVAVDYSALEIHDGMFRIYSEEDIENVAVKYWSENGEIFSEDINSMEWRPLSELMNN